MSHNITHWLICLNKRNVQHLPGILFLYKYFSLHQYYFKNKIYIKYILQIIALEKIAISITHITHWLICLDKRNVQHLPGILFLYKYFSLHQYYFKNKIYIKYILQIIALEKKIAISITHITHWLICLDKRNVQHLPGILFLYKYFSLHQYYFKNKIYINIFYK